MNYEVVVTCAVTGAGDTTAKHPGVPVTPKEVADAAIEAAKAGAAVAHIHIDVPMPRFALEGTHAGGAHLDRKLLGRRRIGARGWHLVPTFRRAGSTNR